MAKTISSTAELELAAFFPGNDRTLSISLGFASDDQANAVVDFGMFLRAVTNVRFVAYRFTVAADDSVTLAVAASVTTDTAAWILPIGLPQGILAWLTDRSGGAWVSNLPASPVVIDHSKIAAPQLLDSVTNWDAPLPQLAGLTRLVALKSAVPFDVENLILVPWFDNSIPDPATFNITRIDDLTNRSVVDLELRNVDSGGLTNVVLRTRSLVVPLPDVGSLVDDATGYLKVRPRSIHIYNALKRLRERGPSLLWTLPQLLAAGWDDEASSAAGTPSPDLSDLKRAIWLGISGLVTLLDPLLVALTMARTGREGPFVSALIAVLEDANSDHPQAPYGAFSTSDVARQVTDLVMDHAQAGDPKKLANLLAETFDLGAVPGPTNLNAETQLLPVLLSLFAHFTPATVPDYPADSEPPSTQFHREKARKRFGNSFDRQVIVELGLLAKLSQDEDAIEAAVGRILSHVGAGNEWLRKLLEYPAAEGASERCGAVLEDFRALLRENFNGLDATRFSQGSLYEAALVTKARMAAKPEGWDDRDLEKLLLESEWFVTRLGLIAPPILGAEPALADLAGSLPIIDSGYLDKPHRDDLLAQSQDPKRRHWSLVESFRNTVAELFPDERFARFVPDPSPRDLPVQIAVDTDTRDSDTFHSRFNGVALLLRQGSNWRYANLASIGLNYPQDGIAVADLTIHPLQPVAIDGERRLFINYAGVPLAGRAFERTFADDAVQEQPVKQSAFHEVDDPDPKVLLPDQLLPAIAYGKIFEIAAHVVSRAGVLPLGLQSSPDKPWLPRPYPSIPPPPGTIREELYLRTTAVGRVMLTEIPPPGTRPRIGVGIENVVPLANDYPRVALAAAGAASALLDVLRNADGTGSIPMPVSAGERFNLRIVDLWWWGKLGSLSIEVLNKPDALPDDVGAAIFSFVPSKLFVGGSIGLRIETDGHRRAFSIGVTQISGALEQVTEVLSVALDPHAKGLAGLSPAWLRIRLLGTGAAVSFADPTAEVRTKYSASRSGTDSLVLVAPGDAADWRPEFKNDVNADLHFSRIGFVDFDRWFSNDKCRARAFPTRVGEQQSDADARAAEFHHRLMTAYLGRMADPGLAALIDALPDLAVSGLRLELCAVDGLGEMPLDLVGKFSPVAQVITFGPLGDRPELNAKFETHRLLKALSAGWGANLKVTCRGKGITLAVQQLAGAKPGSVSWQVNANVPSGVVARLTVRAMVSESFFGEGPNSLKVFDDRVRQLAVDHSEGFYLFEGPSLTIEGMLGELQPLPADGWSKLAFKSVKPVPAGRARSYDLVAGHLSHSENDAWNWRKLGSIDVQTQRWRFTGRPIYSWFDPKGGQRCTSPAVPILDDPQLDDFETEAFFDRDEQDADIQTKQLDPAPAATVLQTFPWDLPSATVFRHRLTLRTRYAGALLPGTRSTQKGYSVAQPGGNSRENWIRVAMLADHSRLQLSRPQLRALIPLTASPTQSDSDAVSPPVMAIIEEPPFVHGGLADRISAEIRTGFGFGFDAIPPAVAPLSDAVHIVDSRKEAGPDPRLTYAPASREMALSLTLKTEGPIGLTYDTPSAPAPVFANSTLLLYPHLLQAEYAHAAKLEEHFLSVGLRRYLDHRWLVDESSVYKGAPGTHSIAEPCWFEFAKSLKLSAGMHVLNVVRSAGVWTAKLNPVAVDPKGPTPLEMIDVARADTELAEGLALLHLPLEEGRASLTLYALPRNNHSGSAKSGESNLPYVLSSFEWHVPNGITALTLTSEGEVFSFPTSASPMTQMNWVRTGKSFDILEAYDLGAKEPLLAEPLRLSASALIATAGQSSLELKVSGEADAVHLHSPLERNPLFVHRHLAAISTVKAGGVGRPIDVYHAVSRIIGRELPIQITGRTDGTLRVITFETPANPLGFHSPHVVMQSATFDLFALIGDKYREIPDQSPIGLNFVYRPLGGPLASISFKIDVRFIDRQRDPLTDTFTINLSEVRDVTTMHFSIVENTVTWICVFPDGSKRTEAVKVTGIKINSEIIMGAETVVISLQNLTNHHGSLPNDKVYWGDISMLTVPTEDDRTSDKKGDIYSLSWNWLFTGRRAEAAIAVTAGELLNVAEAEARIIAISPPISII